MTVGELIELLETRDSEKPVLVYTIHGATPVEGADSYELEQASEERDEFKTAALDRINRIHEIEAQRDALAVSLKGIKIAAQSWARGQDVETARRWHEIEATATQALDALDQTNREGVQ